MPYKDKAKQASLNRKKQRKYLSVETNRQKAAARQMARNAYPIPQKCSVTGCVKMGERHHPDIWKPLEIVWLCHKHHILNHHNITKNPRACSVPNCKMKQHSRGYCAVHYKYLYYLPLVKNKN